MKASKNYVCFIWEQDTQEKYDKSSEVWKTPVGANGNKVLSLFFLDKSKR